MDLFDPRMMIVHTTYQPTRMEMHPDPVYEMLREIIAALNEDKVDEMEYAFRNLQRAWRAHKTLRA